VVSPDQEDSNPSAKGFWSSLRLLAAERAIPNAIGGSAKSIEFGVKPTCAPGLPNQNTPNNIAGSVEF